MGVVIDNLMGGHPPIYTDTHFMDKSNFKKPVAT